MILLLAVAPSCSLPLSPSAPWWPYSAAFNPDYPLVSSYKSSHLSLHRSITPSLWKPLLCSTELCCADETSRSSSLGLPCQVSLLREEISGDPTQKERQASGESGGRQHIMTFHKLLHLLVSVSLYLSISLYLEISGSITIQ